MPTCKNDYHHYMVKNSYTQADGGFVLPCCNCPHKKVVYECSPPPAPVLSSSAPLPPSF